MLATALKQGTVGGEADATRGEAEDIRKATRAESMPPGLGLTEHKQKPEVRRGETGVAPTQTPQLGSLVELHGLVDMPEFNGLVARVEKVLTKVRGFGDGIQVRVTDGTRRKFQIRLHNARAVQENSASPEPAEIPVPSLGRPVGRLAGLPTSHPVPQML